MTQQLGKVFYFDLQGKREMKYNFLLNKSINNIDFKELKPNKPFLFFVKSNNKDITTYNEGFSVNEIFEINSTGFISSNDELNISFTKEEQKSKISDLLSMQENLWRIKYKTPKDVGDWKYLSALNDVMKNNKESNLIEVSYRPFDKRWSLYTGSSRGLYSRARSKVNRHLLKQNNLGLVIGRQGQAVGTMAWNLCFITNEITDHNMYYRGGAMLFPLYIYPA